MERLHFLNYFRIKLKIKTRKLCLNQNNIYCSNCNFKYFKKRRKKQTFKKKKLNLLYDILII